MDDGMSEQICRHLFDLRVALTQNKAGGVGIGRFVPNCQSVELLNALFYCCRQDFRSLTDGLILLIQLLPNHQDFMVKSNLSMN